jgi:hypothetical protein
MHGRAFKRAQSTPLSGVTHRDGQRIDGRQHFNVVEFEYLGPNGDPQG